MGDTYLQPQFAPVKAHVAPRWISADQIRDALPAVEAVDALHGALRGGLRPEADPLRIALKAASAELLVMPSHDDGWFGTKLVTVAPENAGAAVPRIQGVYVLFDGATAAPAAILEATGLTGIRTAAVSMLATRGRVAQFEAPVRVVVFGAGVQGMSHLEALRAELATRSVPLDATIVARSPRRLPPGWRGARQVPVADTAAVNDALAHANMVICATPVSIPLFSGDLVRDDAIVVAVGSHHAEKRELDSALLGRSTVVVEDVGVALQEAGDVVMAIAEGAIAAESLVSLTDLVNGNVPIPASRPMVFKSVGMAWEDLVLAREAFRRITQQAPQGQ